MVDQSKTISLKYHSHLAENIRLSSFGKVLVDRGVIKRDDYNVLLQKNTREDCAKLLLKLYKICNPGIMFQCLKDSGHEELCNDMESGSIPVQKHKMYATPPACGLYLDSQKLIENFSDRVKMKIHNAEAKDCITKFDVWSETLLKAIQRGSLSLSEERKYADCCFVLLDALVVLYRTHSLDRQSVFGKKEFKNMEYLISKTAHPSLTRIRYQSRYGVSLFQGGETDKGLQYISSALGDANLFLSGKDIGNILFALVNIKLELYAQNPDDELKKEILDYVELGIRYFENENEDTRNNWRCIYLDKKTCCYLGLNSDGKPIEGAVVSEEDLDRAKDCLQEAEQLDSVMDIRRRMHFYRARAKYHNHQKNYKISVGFLEEALELAKMGSFHHDEKILIQQCSSFSRSEKEAIEHATEIVNEPEYSVNTDRNRELDTKDLDKRALEVIAAALHMDTFTHVIKREPTEN